MSEIDTPTTEKPLPDPASERGSLLASLFSQTNITTALAAFAVVLAGAPYVMPQLQAYQVSKGLMARPAMLDAANEKLAMQKADLSRKAATEAIKSHQDSLLADKTDPIIGNPAAPIKVVEFLDYNCGYCRAATPQIKDFLTQNPDVAVVVKEYPVININSRPLASYALAAAQSGHYEAIHYAFMTQKVSSDAGMAAILAKSGLDPVATKALAQSKAIQDHIDRIILLGSDLGLTGTPAFIVNGTLIDGARMDELKVAVAAARAGTKG